MGLSIDYELPKLAEECKHVVNAFYVVRWPETIALLRRLGVALDRPYQRIVIDLEFIEGTTRVFLIQRGSDANDGGGDASG